MVNKIETWYFIFTRKANDNAPCNAPPRVVCDPNVGDFRGDAVMSLKAKFTAKIEDIISKGEK